MLNIVWFRRDLRVADHRPLLNAVAEGMVVPLFVVEPDYWAQPECSARQWRFVARALTALRSQLAVIGAPLVVRVGDPVDILGELEENARGMVLWSHATGKNAWAVARDARVEAWVTERGIPWNRIDADHGKAAEPPDVMIAHGLPPGRIVSERILFLDDDACKDSPAGPRAAQQLVDELLLLDPAIGAEAYDRGAADLVARLSAHMAWGTISRRELRILLTQALEEPDAVQTRAIEVLLADLNAPAKDAPSDGDAGKADDDTLHRWISGRSGLPIIDAGMRALAARGWLRADLLDASLSHAIADLGLPPAAASVALQRIRVDHDPGRVAHHADRAAAFGAGAAARSERFASLSRQIDPDGVFIREWLEDLDAVPTEALHAPWTADATTRDALRAGIGSGSLAFCGA